MHRHGHSTRKAAALLIAVVLGAAGTGCSSDGDRDGDGGATTTEGSMGADGDGTGPPVEEGAWRVHPVDSRFKGANSLGPGDVDGDGRDDYVTNYEFSQRYVIALHPGTEGDVRTPWPTVDVFAPDCADPSCGVNPEFAVLGDVDGDGALDVVAAQGWSEYEAWEGSEAGVRVIWGPGPDRARDAEAWVDGGRIPATADEGHHHFVRLADVDADGALDIVAGGRVHGGNGSRAGLLWLEAPDDPAERRDLGRWVRHDIAPDQTGGRNFVFADLDGDGDDDIVVANADFDTPAEEESLVWYENPGPAGVREPWAETVIHRSPDFHTKPQIAVADLDGDGLDDLVTQVDDEVWWFRATGTDPVAFEQVVIPKDPMARHPSRPIRVVDLDGDGQLDLVGGLVHEDGTLPGDKASLFWMSHAGDPADPDGWTTRAITWGAGTTGVILTEFAEKWDLLELVDLDGDGDLDLLANNEEWWEDAGQPGTFWEPAPPPVHAVVWFENRLGEPDEPVAEEDGLVVVEAEDLADQGDGSWTSRAQVEGYEGTGYAQAVAVTGDVPADAGEHGRDLLVDLDGGTYDVWARVSVPERWGDGLGGEASDSAWLGIPGTGTWLVGDTGDLDEGWTWVRAASDVELDAGEVTVRLHAREGGLRVDRVALAGPGAAFDGS